MSRLEIYGIRPDGDAVWTGRSLKNCALFGPYVFETLCQAYHVDQQRPFDHDALWPWAASDHGSLLWDFERLTLRSFYDRAILHTRALPLLADAYERFETHHNGPYPEGLRTLAKLLRALPPEISSSLPYIGFQPSNAECLWLMDEEQRPYNFYKDELHLFPLDGLEPADSVTLARRSLYSAVQRLIAVESLHRADLLSATHDEIRARQQHLYTVLGDGQGCVSVSGGSVLP